MAKLIFGCGYLGQRVAQLWLDAGHSVFALTRRADRADQLARLGIQPLIGNVVPGLPLPPLPPADTVLFAIGHDRAAGHSIHEVYVEGLRRTLASLAPGTKRFIYLSSVGVYSQTDGSLVDETSPCQPKRPGGLACLAAEQLLAASTLGPHSLILRAGGIYGPGRIPRRKDLQAGTPLDAPPHGYLNLIHVDDLAAAVLAAEQIQPPKLYNITDSHPVLRREYYTELARLLRVAPPTFVTDPNPSAVSERATTDKLVDSSRILRELPFRLRYPTYREALAAILAAEHP